MAAQTRSTYISGTIINSVEIPTVIMGFSTMPNLYAIHHSSRNISISDLSVHIAISGCRSLSQSFACTFFDLVMVENPRIAVGISTLSMIVLEM